MGTSQKLYEEAKKIIPGGTQLLSKRPEMFLPDIWPAYYRRAKGCKVWDMDGNEYIDMSYMGIGANVLGYAHDYINDAVKSVMDNGNMCTLNAPEEVSLAKMLMRLHPWAEMVRYAKSGGEAASIAVRIARAFSGKDIVLFCGYHGWSDWYLAANIREDNALEGHLLKGLSAKGIPKGLAGTSIPFHYNNFDEFDGLLQKYKGSIAAVIMEPIRNEFPKDDFLTKIRKRTAEEKIVLIFDEITAGFRLNCGGAHQILGIDPDLAIFGKALSNGYPMAAIIGNRDVMNAAQETFISSTYWTDRVGLAAAIAMIQYYEENSVNEFLAEIGELVQKGWQDASKKAGLKIQVSGIPPLSHFDFLEGDALQVKTLFTQEMLKKGYLANTAFYASYAHERDMVVQYLKNVETVFGLIAEAIDSGTILQRLEGPVCHAGFERLT